MSAGFPADKLTIDARAGQLAMTLRDTLRQVQLFKTFLDSKNDAALIGLGYNQADVDLLRASYTDLNKLQQIANAAATQSATSDFFFNAKLLLGVV
jgi:hypothetical protein